MERMQLQIDQYQKDVDALRQEVQHYRNVQHQQQQQQQQQQQSQNPYYASRQASQQLPPINPYAPAQHDHSYPNSAVSTTMDGSFMDPKSPPRRMNSQSQQMPMPDKTPVPEFRKIRGPQDLRPKTNKQPAHRRANPEGGFISVCTSCVCCERWLQTAC